jgi:hypothetical protein
MRVLLAFPVLCALLSSAAQGQIAIAPEFSTAYSLSNLGSPPGVPANLGGICFLRNNPNVLLIGGAANGQAGTIYSIGVTRDASHHITGYSASAAAYAAGQYNDGGLAYAPNGTLLFTQYSGNGLAQVLPSQLGVAPSTDLTALGIAGSVGTLQFIPSGFPNAGSLLVASYGSSRIYTLPLTLQPSGYYAFGQATEVTSQQFTPNGPEGLVYVPQGSALLPFPSMLVSEYGLGKVRAYEVGAMGQPLAGTVRDFVTGLSGAEGGVLDPLTGDFLFSTYSGTNTVIVVRGFNVPACNAADVGSQGGVALPDGLLDNNDFIVFINYFFNANALADVGQQGGMPGHDALFDNNDFVVFINRFFSPCD